jgi:hypothetical protein
MTASGRSRHFRSVGRMSAYVPAGGEKRTSLNRGVGPEAAILMPLPLYACGTDESSVYLATETCIIVRQNAEPWRGPVFVTLRPGLLEPAS